MKKLTVIFNQYRSYNAKNYRPGQVVELPAKVAKGLQSVGAAKIQGETVKSLDPRDENKMLDPRDEVKPLQPDENKEDQDKGEPFPKHKGGGYYELSNGDTVKGKEKADKAEKALEA